MKLLRDDRGTHYVCWNLSHTKSLVHALAELARYYTYSVEDAVAVLNAAIKEIQQCESTCES